MAEGTINTEIPPQVTLVDLQNAVQIIDAAAERGAFKGGELSSVGNVRDRIASFVEFATKQNSDTDENNTMAENVE